MGYYMKSFKMVSDEQQQVFLSHLNYKSVHIQKSFYMNRNVSLTRLVR